MPRLTLRDVRRRYGQSASEALAGIDLDVDAGAFVAIEGPSGCGKSTLLNTIGLLDTPTSGSYRVDDVETTALTSRQLTELRSDRFAFVFQSFHLLDRRPVIDSAELSLVYRGVPRAERRERARQALDDVGLAHLEDQIAATLSGGERQRVAIARALAANAPTLVADEPTGNLDSANSAIVVESLERVNARGTTVVLVTHSPEVAAAAGQRVRLRDGARVDEFPSNDHTDTATDRSTPVQAPDTPPGRASTLRFTDLFRDAVAGLSSRRGRSAGLVAAVAVGVALATATLGLSGSSASQVADTFNAHANRDVTVSWGGESLSPGAAASEATMPARLADLAGVDTVGILVDQGSVVVQASPARRILQVAAFTTSTDGLEAARTKTRWASGHAKRLAAGEVAVGANLAEQLHLADLNARPAIRVDAETLTVVAIIEKSGRMPSLVGALTFADSAADFLTEPPAQVLALLRTAPGAAQQVASQVRLVVDPFQPEALTVDAPLDPSTLRADIESDLQNTLFAFTALAVLGSMVGLANSMVLSVLERRQEFGLRRAVGARPIHVSALVLTESSIIGALGGVAGLALGLAAVLTITVVRHWIPVFDFRLAPIAVAGGIVVGAFGGVLAATRASRILPHEALKQ
jgi:macrolide transport system ATP-binding/permease protein